jgi:hypothetical protein
MVPLLSNILYRAACDGVIRFSEIEKEAGRKTVVEIRVIIRVSTLHTYGGKRIAYPIATFSTTNPILTFGIRVLRLIQINHQPDAKIFHFIILTSVYSSTCFGRSFSHHQELNDCSGSLWFYLHIVVIVVLCSWSGRPARPPV